MIKELVVISGKGGTGKTSLTASLAALAEKAVLADCDVDAADLHLILNPKIQQQHDFKSGHEAIIREDDCLGCGICFEYCRYEAVKPNGTGFTIDPIACEGCGVCVRFCPTQAIDFPERLCGTWMISETRFGPMVHAQLGVAAENSGKLVSTVRREAHKLAESKNYPLIIIDGPPGIGCPVIASITGASLILIVTEPTVSGEHDLERVISLAKHFDIPALVCVNKWDINEEMTDRIERKAQDSGATVIGRIRYDNAITKAQLQRKSLIETGTPSSGDVQQIWKNLQTHLQQKKENNE
jgi:MinD superfamily P-loop ATPase